MPGSFFDTNVLLYVASGDATKADVAESLVAEGGAICVQGLNEMANVARRKMGLPWAEVRSFLSLFRGLLSIHPVTTEIHDDGLVLAERYGFSIFDALIVAAAQRADCHTLWSEGMQHGMRIGRGLHIRNPFLK
jgi:predicted nucleic acid-binding protein